MGKVLGIVYRAIAMHLTRKAGHTIHYHLLFLDGVYIDSADKSRLRFRRVKAPTNDELTQLTCSIAHRVARCLERQGLLEREAGHTYLTADGVDEDPESPMNQLLGS